MGVGPIQSFEDLNRTNIGGRENLFLSHLIPELEHHGSFPVLGLVDAPLVLRLLDCDAHYTTGLLGSLACRWQIMGFLSLPDHVG